MEKDLDKIIKRFINSSKKFVSYSAYREGTLHYMISNQIDGGLISEYEYFIFTKSTKTLISIYQLLKLEQNEDAVILLRSIFEGYMSCRYFNEAECYKDNPNSVYRDMIFNPINISLHNFSVSDGVIYSKKGTEVGRLLNPSKFKIGSDKKYFYDLYEYFSEHSHPNFANIHLYTENLNFKFDKSTNSLFIRMLTVYIFTRLYEYIVTVEDEDFINSKNMLLAHKLVADSYKMLKCVIDNLIDENTKIVGDKNFKKLLKNMRNALDEEISDVDKS